MKKIFSCCLVACCMLISSASFCMAESTADILNGLSRFMDSLSNLAETADSLDDPSKPETKTELSGPTVDVVVAGETLHVHASFKETMDQFEAFFDRYVDVISSEDVELTTYIDMLARYAETLEALEDIDEDTLSKDDDIYYLDVLNRINLKLLMAEP